MNSKHLGKDIHLILKPTRKLFLRPQNEYQKEIVIIIQGSKNPTSVPKGKVRLYGNRFCPYAQRIILVLDAKKIPHEIINIDLLNKPDWLYDKVPIGKVPSIELDSGDVLYESLVICDYLDEKFGTNKLHPKDPLQKAKDQLLLRQFNRVINAMLKTVMIGRMDGEEARVIAEGLAVFENELKNRPGPHFGGDKPNMLDYMIWPWCERSDLLKLFGKDVILRKDKYKKLMEWKNLMIDDNIVKKSLLDLDTHMKYFQSYKSGCVDYDGILHSRN